jgi:hypothetical protein
MNLRATDTDFRHQVGSSEDRWSLRGALLLWVFLSLMLWALIIGSIYILI